MEPSLSQPSELLKPTVKEYKPVTAIIKGDFLDKSVSSNSIDLYNSFMNNISNHNMNNLIEITVDKRQLNTVIPTSRNKKIKTNYTMSLHSEDISKVEEEKQDRPIETPNISTSGDVYFTNNNTNFSTFIFNLLKDRYMELGEETNKLVCYDKTNSLLPYQEMVREYLNKYTPYRGVLLYHDLVSGKICTSIMVAEGMKNDKQIIVLLPQSRIDKYLAELKKCGDLLYRLNQYWERIETKELDEATLITLSKALQVPENYIKQKQHIWLVNTNQKQNTYANLSEQSNKELNEQIDFMIKQKYQFIELSTLTEPELIEYTNFFSKNLFDDKVIIIDDAHILINRITNKINQPFKKDSNVDYETTSTELAQKIRTILPSLNATTNTTDLATNYSSILSKTEYNQLINSRINLKDKKDMLSAILNRLDKHPTAFNKSLAIRIYEYLLSAQNCRVVLLTGTPIVNSPCEMGVIFNIIFGYIKTWNLNLEISGKQKDVSIDTQYFKENLPKVLQNSPTVYDYLSFSPSKNTLTVTRNPFGFINSFETNATNQPEYKGIVLNQPISDKMFLKNMIENLLKISNKDFQITSVKVDKINKNYKLLPDDSTAFEHKFILKGAPKNKLLLQRRILGLTSYHMNEPIVINRDIIVTEIDMSELQFQEYLTIRKVERNFSDEKQRNKISRSFRLFSRMFCNVIIPERPLPFQADGFKQFEKQLFIQEDEVDLEKHRFLIAADKSYESKIKEKLNQINIEREQYLTRTALEKYSPKFLNILTTINDITNKDKLHVVYSQFRELEGIEVFALALETNGHAKLKLQKNNGMWVLDMKPEDYQKPKYAVLFETESNEEKIILLNIFNNAWNNLPESIASKLKQFAPNNTTGNAIKTLLATYSATEEFHKVNSDFVHIMEPCAQNFQMKQIIELTKNICNVKHKVQVFLYVMRFTQNQITTEREETILKEDGNKTSEQTLYETTSQNEKNILPFLDIIKETAFDCSLTTKNKCFTNTNKTTYNPNYNDDEVDSLLKTDL